MQTVANKRGLHVQVQMEVNQSSFNRLDEHFVHCKAAIQHQLLIHSPDLYHALTEKDSRSGYSLCTPSVSHQIPVSAGDGGIIRAAQEKVEIMHDRFVLLTPTRTCIDGVVVEGCWKRPARLSWMPLRIRARNMSMCY